MVNDSAALYLCITKGSIVRENVRDTAKNVKSHDFLDFEKKT